MRLLCRANLDSKNGLLQHVHVFVHLYVAHLLLLINDTRKTTQNTNIIIKMLNSLLSTVLLLDNWHVCSICSRMCTLFILFVPLTLLSQHWLRLLFASLYSFLVLCQLVAIPLPAGLCLSFSFFAHSASPLKILSWSSILCHNHRLFTASEGKRVRETCVVGALRSVLFLVCPFD